MVKLNFSEMEAEATKGFPTLDEGTYTLEVLESEYEINKKGNPQIKVNFVEPDTKIRVTSWLQLSGRGTFMLFNFLKSAGIKPLEGEVSADSQEFEDWVDSFVGEDVTAVVNIRDYVDNDGNKRQSNNIKSFVEKGKAGKGPRKKSRTI